MTDYVTTILKNEFIAEGIKKLVVKLPEMPGEIHAGQFLQLKVPDESFILRRPLCIADFDFAKKTITAIYQIKGGGTKRLAECKPEETLKMLLPLGKPFSVPPAAKKVMIIGGGMGCAVLPAIFREYEGKEFYLYAGFSKKEAVICGELAEKSEKYVANIGGFITDDVARDLAGINPDIILSCGPAPLYKALKSALKNFDRPVQVSLEERMCCGIGACYVCACKIKCGNEIKTLRVCKDGPVFNLNEVEL